MTTTQEVLASARITVDRLIGEADELLADLHQAGFKVGSDAVDTLGKAVRALNEVVL